MNEGSGPVLPPLSADLLLVHAPAFFDFRNRRDVYFPFLGTSGDVPITPLYEYFPVGFKTLERYLGERGHSVRLLNLSTVLLRYPNVDVRDLIEALDVKVLGIDLHWMVHVQGSLAVAERIKEIRNDIPIIFGGISSTYYADELIDYPFIDMVMRGYDTHEPMDQLMRAMGEGDDLHHIPNLVWKQADGTVVDNDFGHKPDSFGCGIDWSTHPNEEIPRSLPIREFISTQNAGCAYNCGWCGGSREAFRRIFDRKRAMARKPPEEIEFEFSTMKDIPDVDQFHFYSVGSYNEPRVGMARFVEQVAEAPIRSISYEQFRLTPDDMLVKMAQANEKTVITLSPESHDPRVAKLAGRGVYTNDEMEAWLERAFDAGIHGVDIWYFVGMPEQDEGSVMETVEYCRHLLERFRGTPANPMICPMIPFLDPASTFFEEPEKHGYRVFYRTVEEHRRGMERASLINRINYETEWLSRRDLVHVGFRAVKELMEAKGELGALPRSFTRDYNERIDAALELIDRVHEIDCLEDEAVRRRELDAVGDEIQQQNQLIFYSGVMNQAFPVPRRVGGRWFDELGWSAAILDGLNDSTLSGPYSGVLSPG